MAKKTTRRHKTSRSHYKKRFQARSRDSAQPPLPDRILAYLGRQAEPASTATIMQELSLPGYARKTVKEALISLVREGKVQQRNKRFFIDNAKGLLKAALALTSRGFGFATVEGQKPEERDIFISSENLAGASHGDTVSLRLLGITSRGRREGVVVRILNRSVTTLCGLYTEDRKGGYLLPDNPKIPFTVFIHKQKSMKAKNGEAVLARITDYGTGEKGPSGEIIEILGDPLTVGVQIRMAVEQLHLSRSFPDMVLEEVEKLEPLVECRADRKDLRHIEHVTIDGADAKDFDDAIAVEETARGYRLYVSIADVGHYVQAGSSIDMEAYQRGTSVYFPNQVLPMLPERLSNDLCSLVPHQDRPAFSAVLDFDRKGKQLQAQFHRSMINSRMRFTYDTVHRIVYLKEETVRQEHGHLLPMLTAAAKLSSLLRKKRRRRGSLGFNIPEAEIRVRDDQIVSMGHAQRNEAHMLIEDFMLAANEAVAETLDRARQDVLYRIHERPDPDKVSAFTEAAGAMGLHLPKTEISSSWFAGVLDEARNKPAEYVINNLLLRTMQQARYSPENLGHFGLAAEYYLHFTSPIRRYPDLIAHRVLRNLLVQQAGTGKRMPVLAEKENLDQAALHLSGRERLAVDAERDVHARLSGLFMVDRIGEEFDAVVSGVSSYGLFVELLEYFISGGVPVQSMDDDYYFFDSRAHRLIGELTRQVYQLGHTVRVRLEHVDLGAKRITFSLVSEVKDSGQGNAHS